MFGWVLIIASVVLMGRVADMEDRSPIIWGALTFLLCVTSVRLIPLPLLNIAFGLGAVIAAMAALKALGR